VTDAVRRILGAAGAPSSGWRAAAAWPARAGPGRAAPGTMDAITRHQSRSRGRAPRRSARVHLDQRAAAQGARSLRGGAAGAQPRRGAHPLQRGGPGDRAGETEGLYSGIEPRWRRSGDTTKVATRRRARASPAGASATRAARAQEGHRLPQANIMKAPDGMFMPLRPRGARRRVRGDRLPGDDQSTRAAWARAGSHAVRSAPAREPLRRRAERSGRGLVGGLGVVPGANIGDQCAVFEAVPRSAPTSRDGTSPTRRVFDVRR